MTVHCLDWRFGSIGGWSHMDGGAAFLYIQVGHVVDGGG